MTLFCYGLTISGIPSDLRWAARDEHKLQINYMTPYHITFSSICAAFWDPRIGAEVNWRGKPFHIPRERFTSGVWFLEENRAKNVSFVFIKAIQSTLHFVAGSYGPNTDLSITENSTLDEQPLYDLLAHFENLNKLADDRIQSARANARRPD